MPAQREWFSKDYYKVLGVSEGATDKEIIRAYRKLAKRYHPDANPGAEERFKEVSAAYDVLGDAAKRREYDEARRLGAVSANGGGPRSGPFRPGVRVEDFGDLLGDLLDGGRTSPGRAGPRRGDDVEAGLHLSFPEAVGGVTTSVDVITDSACGPCGGTGSAPGTSPVICSVCGGRGVKPETHGLFSVSQPCARCRGTGMRVETPCPRCHGSGVERRNRRVTVRVPPGVEDGQRIRLRGRGGAGHNGGPAGDLFVRVDVGPHRLFGRKGKDLTLTVPVTFPEAALGATVRVPTLDGPVSVRIPAGTRSGRVFRVRGRGAPVAGGAGDLLVTVEVDVPQRMSDAQREAVEALAAASPDSPRAHLGVE